MELKNYKEIPKSKTVIVTDINIINILLDYPELTSGLYDDIYMPPEPYNYCKQNMDITTLKRFLKSVKKIEFNASKTAIQSMMEQSEILDEEECYAMLYGMLNHIDVIVEDPRKNGIFIAHNVNTVQLSDLIATAAITKK